MKLRWYVLLAACLPLAAPAATPPAPAPAAQAQPAAAEPTPFARLKKVFDARNARAKELTGYTFFEDLKLEPDHTTLRVVASDVWLKEPQAGRDDNVSFILWQWSEAQPESARGTPLKVVVYDNKGKPRMEMKGKAGEVKYGANS